MAAGPWPPQALCWEPQSEFGTTRRVSRCHPCPEHGDNNTQRLFLFSSTDTCHVAEQAAVPGSTALHPPSPFHCWLGGATSPCSFNSQLVTDLIPGGTRMHSPSLERDRLLLSPRLRAQWERGIPLNLPFCPLISE